MHYSVFGASPIELPAKGPAFQVDDGRKGAEGVGSGGGKVQDSMASGKS